MPNVWNIMDVEDITSLRDHKDNVNKNRVHLKDHQTNFNNLLVHGKTVKVSPWYFPIKAAI
jgi:hypothetical protein